MKISFDAIQRESYPNFKGGDKCYDAKMWVDENTRIMHGQLEPGASIGMHQHADSSEIIYLLSGRAVARIDGQEETLSAGDCHYCPKGSSHSLSNESTELLEFFAVVPKQ